MSDSRIPGLFAGGVPLVAASFADGTDPAGLAELVAAGLDVAELRFDWFSSCAPEYVARELATFVDVPTLGTVRSAEEGGAWSASEEERLAVFRVAVPALDAVDVELAADGIRDDVVRLARGHGCAVVVSHHDFERTPDVERLQEIVTRGRAAGADCVKIAVMPRSDADVRMLCRFTLDHADEPLIVIAMGALGSVSRILFPVLGSRLTFASLGDRVVSGQLPFGETVAMLRTFSPGFAAKKSGL